VQVAGDQKRAGLARCWAPLDGDLVGAGDQELGGAGRWRSGAGRRPNWLAPELIASWPPPALIASWPPPALIASWPASALIADQIGIGS
jgi:hypothetical protein